MDQQEQASFFIEKLNAKDSEIARLRAALAEARAELDALTETEERLRVELADRDAVESESAKAYDRLDEISARLSAAYQPADVWSHDAESGWIVETRPSMTRVKIADVGEPGPCSDFLANAPTDLTWCLAEIERLTRELAEAKRERDEARRERDDFKLRIDEIRRHVPSEFDGDSFMGTVMAVIDCAHGEPGHYWKDGCPSCWAKEQEALRAHAASATTSPQPAPSGERCDCVDFFGGPHPKCVVCNGTGKERV